MRRIGLIVAVEIESVLSKFVTKLIKKDAATMYLEIVNQIISEL